MPPQSGGAKSKTNLMDTEPAIIHQDLPLPLYSGNPKPSHTLNVYQFHGNVYSRDKLEESEL